MNVAPNCHQAKIETKPNYEPSSKKGQFFAYIDRSDIAENKQVNLVYSRNFSQPKLGKGAVVLETPVLKIFSCLHRGTCMYGIMENTPPPLPGGIAAEAVM